MKRFKEFEFGWRSWIDGLLDQIIQKTLCLFIAGIFLCRYVESNHIDPTDIGANSFNFLAFSLNDTPPYTCSHFFFKHVFFGGILTSFYIYWASKFLVSVISMKPASVWPFFNYSAMTFFFFDSYSLTLTTNILMSEFVLLLVQIEWCLIFYFRGSIVP